MFTRKTSFPWLLSLSVSCPTTGFLPWLPTTAHTFFLSIVEPSLVAILAVTRINVPALIDSVSDVSDNHKTKRRAGHTRRRRRWVEKRRAERVL